MFYPFPHQNHHYQDKPMRTSFSGSAAENMHVTPDAARSATACQLHRALEIITEELERRALSKPYFIVEKHQDYLLVKEAHLIEDEDGPRYVHSHSRDIVTKFYITSESAFHQVPEAEQVFEIYCRSGNKIDVARRVATHG
jgi:hypothetical protein